MATKNISATLYNATPDDLAVHCQCIANLRFNLYSSAGNIGKELTIKKTDSSTNTITIYPASGETIDGESSVTITMLNEYKTFKAISGGWTVVDEYRYAFGDVTGGNYSKFEADGTYVAEGAAITYRDEYVGGAYFVPTGANAPDEVNATIGGVVTKKYAFDGVNTVEKLGNTFEIAHDIALDAVNAGTEYIEIHVHFAPSDNNTGDVKFTVAWCLIPVNGAPISGTPVTLTKTIAANQQYFNLLKGGNLTVPEGGFDVGDLIEFTISRDPGDEADTYAHDVIFYKAALHVPVDTLGSRSIYTK